MLPEVPFNIPVGDPASANPMSVRIDNTIVADMVPFPGQAQFDELDALTPAEDDFYANLAERPDIAHELGKIGQTLLRYVESDLESRSQWDQILADGLREMGLDRTQDKRSRPFNGAFPGTHPLLAQSCVDFQARAIKELFPANGPVRTKIARTPTPELTDRADRVRKFMNWQLTAQMPEYRTELDRMLMMLPITGSSIKKLRYDTVKDRPRSEYVPIEHFIVPYHARDLETCPRYTHKLEKYPSELDADMAAGMYRDIDLTAPSNEDDPSAVSQKLDKIQGKQLTDDEADGVYYLYEVHTDIALPDAIDGGDVRPYIVTVEKRTGTVLAIRRNWREDDPQYTKRLWFVHYKFIPWEGFYGIGLLHLIGGIAKGATAALRLLMDSGAIASTPGGVRLRNARVSGANIAFRPLEYTEVDAPGVTDIRQIVMPYPTNGPSPVLFQLLGFLTQAGEKFANIASQVVAEANSNMPATTTLALIEQGSVVYSAIHARLHYAQAAEFNILAELNSEFLDDAAVAAAFGGEQVVTAQDFDDNIDILPTSDPDTFSAIQRSAKAQATLSLCKEAAADGVNVDMREAYLASARAISVDNIDALFPDEPDPVTTDPLSENIAAMDGMKVRAAFGQDHQSHMAVHLSFVQLPGVAATPEGRALMAHYMEHMRLMVAEMVQAQAGVPAVPPGEDLPIPLQNAYASVTAQMLPGALAPIAEALQAALKIGDSSDALVKAAVMDTQRKAQDDIQKAQGKAVEAMAANATKERIAASDNATQIELKRMDIEAQREREQAEDARDIEAAALGLGKFNIST